MDTAAGNEESKDANAQRRKSTMSSSTAGAANLNNSLEVTFANQDQYIYSVVQNMVDNVCLYEARVDALQREAKQANPSGEQANNSVETDQPQPTDDEETKDDEVDGKRLNDRISNIKLNPVEQAQEDYVPSVEI